ncbi:Inner membrane protein translocase involved in respiratory chain assembly [Phaffia rhodozyma]|uniref:Inner membrane protein translocase involved in respiratory chain assembly n=1 Tax=Phaffia rhodozyma TaxID=264483 RepID=A0A0F7SG48_PHARH|nr:Inner membrane protein translocase involved in respiratory chain assembly [Phaffia rhodozyma]
MSTSTAADALAQTNPSWLAHLLIDHPWPFPSPLPPYSTTIIVSCIALRFLITVPVSVWARRREAKLKEKAMPMLMHFRDKARLEVVPGCRKEGYSHEQYLTFVKERISAESKRLINVFNCHPLPTVLVPILVQFPLFLTLVYITRSATMSPTPLLYEHLPSFLGATPLVEPDSTGTLPIAVGLTLFANVEIMRLARKERDALNPFHVEKPNLVETIKVPKKGGVEGETEEIERLTKKGWTDQLWSNVMRAGALALVPISIFAPVAMQVYFLTTYLFTISQTLIFQRIDRARLLRIRAILEASRQPSGTGSTSVSTKLIPSFVKSDDAKSFDPKTYEHVSLTVPPLPEGTPKTIFKSAKEEQPPAVRRSNKSRYS